MVLALLFAPSTVYLMEVTCKYICSCANFHFNKTQFTHSSTPVISLVEYFSGHMGCSSFVAKVDIFSALHHDSSTLSIFLLACILFDIVLRIIKSLLAFLFMVPR